MAIPITPEMVTAGATLASAYGSGLTGAEDSERKKKELELEQKKFDWLKNYQSRELGMGQIKNMRESFRNSLYNSLTRY
jgi:hypothetical protein